jgi:serine/threonine-protein kinase
MNDEPRVQQLLDEIFDSERAPEDVCGDCPELLPVVRQRWRQMRLVEAELDAMFPTPGPRQDADTPVPWHPGTDLPHIPGYEVEAVLGRGGMGIVYKARDLRLNRPVALKMLLAGAYAGPEERQRFLREAEAVASLRHPNIVQVYGAGDHERRPYFTMEYVEGGSLAQLLLGTPQPARSAAALLATLAEAVQVAHQGGIVHRDLKPANILLQIADCGLRIADCNPESAIHNPQSAIPKIADFGLARHFDGGPAVTRTGARVGTPSYMAPEQALGNARAVGPAADVYALGAILYEMLTGRPPFRGETAAETERQVIAEEPVPPARLNTKVPRDLETICLKCLHKDPQRRYLTAAALAEDVRRFQRGEPIAARPAGLPERTAKWVRRHPTLAATLAASLLLAVALVLVSLWLAVQQAHERDAFEADLKELAALQGRARWDEAQGALERAKARLGGGGPGDLRRRLDQAGSDLDLVIQLDKIRLKRVTRGELAFYKAQADTAYARAFEQAGLGKVHDPPSGVAAAIDASAVRGALVAAVYDWAVCAADKAQRGWLFEVARQTDSGPDRWRERALDPAAWEDREALAELARTAPVAREPGALLLGLCERLRGVGGDAVPLLQRVQKEYPADFWANLILGNAMLRSVPQEAAGYYRAALAGRPRAAVGYCAVGDALGLQHLPDQAIDYYEKAIHHDPDYARAYSNVGDVLQEQGRFDGALGYYEKALRLDPDYAWAHHNLANTLRMKGRLDAAYAQYQQALRIDPKNPEVQKGLRTVLMRQGRGQEVLAAWRQALDAGPPEHDTWAGYAELCLFLGRPDEYRRARVALLDRFGATTSPYIAEPVSRTCLLLPGTEDELRKAAALADRAVAARESTPDWIYRYFLFAKGLAEYRQGRLAGAAAVMQGEASRVLGPAPGLVLAMAQSGQGQQKQARKTLAKAVVAFDWSAALADGRDIWIAHILRREAEALILPNLPTFLRGDYQPRDNDERLALVGACQCEGRNRAAARLYADAFANDPALAEDLATQCRSRAALGDKQPVGRIEELATECRYPAARCAALAGCGVGADGADVSEAERRRWRKQAGDWLRADLSVWAKILDSGSPAARVLVRKTLTSWESDPALAGLRGSAALQKLPASERREWRALWEQVAALHQRAQGNR